MELTVRSEDKSKILSEIYALDFSKIKYKICQPSPNIARVWSREGAEDAIRQYRNFMYLLKKYHQSVDHNLVPSLEVDEIWHHHILDTRFYHHACQQIYGCYRHHVPYVGPLGADEQSTLFNNFEATQALYYQEFSEYMYEVDF